MNIRRLIPVSTLALTLLAGAACSEDSPKDYELVVYHQNDRHSHWLGQPNMSYTGAIGDGTLGGMGRWAKLYADDPSPAKLLLDAGDFKMGTLFGGANGAGGDLDLLAELGFSAAAIGNHELDWGPAGLVGMIDASQAPGVPLVCANIRFDADDAGDDALEALYGPEGVAGKRIHPYILREVGGVSVGITGVLGPVSYSTVTYNAVPVTFATTIAELAPEVQAVVDEMRAEGADVVIVLAHMGITEQAGQPAGDTIELLRQVRGIDLALSGHEHTVSSSLAAITGPDGETAWALEAGDYGRYLSHVVLTRAGGARAATGELLAIDDSLAADPAKSALVDPLIQSIEQELLQSFPVLPAADAFLTGEFDQSLTTSGFPLERTYFDAHNLGYL
ncbi:MAG TPA: metallophosphoesterase, partial [Myxococcota bacterium]|nr:metallophosphoesterase [Myxococcota bacterium]